MKTVKNWVFLALFIISVVFSIYFYNAYGRCNEGGLSLFMALACLPFMAD
jgi:hypothetical protein